MSSSVADHNEAIVHSFHRSHVHRVIESILVQFDHMMRSYVFFNLAFLTIGTLETILFIIFFTFLVQSAILALSLAFVFLTFFSYFILRLYYQTKKPEQFQELRDRYVNACKSLLGYNEGNAQHHIALASACAKLAENLKGKEFLFYNTPESMPFLAPYLKKFSYRCHWYDVHRIQELLLLSAIDENVELVKCQPTSMEAHAALANAYVMLSELYVDPSKEALEEECWPPSHRMTASLERKYRATAERAIEEFKIIKEFSPNDPWAHLRLAQSYSDLKMPQEEIKEYETILQLNPADANALLKLGKLYFQQGLNAKGLRLYEQLKTAQSEQAEELIRAYGAFTFINE